MKDRIRQLMDAQHMNQQTFANYIGVNGASLSSIFTGRTSPTLNIVNAIKNKFPNVNTDWLLYGNGGMFNLPQQTSARSSEPFTPSLFDAVNMAEDTSVKTQTEISPKEEKEVKVNPVLDIAEEANKNASKTFSQPLKHIVEIKVFYSDGTFETLKP